MPTVLVSQGGRQATARPKESHQRLKGYSANRRAYDARRRKSAKSEATKAFMDVLRHDPCCFCGAAAASNRNRVSDVDHIEPLTTGGLDRWENMTAACASCNRGRREMSVLHFMLRRSR